jgi:hypothetical protein
MAGDTQAHRPDMVPSAAHPVSQKMMDLTDTLLQPVPVQDGAYAAIVHELQNNPELQGFFKKPGAEPAHQPGSEGLEQLELYDNPATASAALLAQVDHARNDKADQRPVSDPNKDPAEDWAKYILEHDHSRDVRPNKDQAEEWVKYILEHDHSRDVRNK